MNGIDVLLVNPGDRKQIYQQLGTELAACEPPVWAGLLATFLRRRQISVAILDANAEGLSPETAARRVSEYRPKLVAVVAYGQNPSASTMVMPAAGAVCREIKRQFHELPVILLGGHVAALPERTLSEEAVDFVCDGEGPYTLFELLNALKSPSPDFHGVRGLLYLEDGRPVRTDPAPLVQNLDEEMPAVAWDLLPMERYVAHNWHCFGHIDERQPYASLYTSLGCPFHCDFCCIHAPFKTGQKALGMPDRLNSYRTWSSESVLAQLDVLVNTYGVRNVKFADEIFVLNKDHVLSICSGIVERGYDLNIWCYSRVNSWTHEMLHSMKTAGINWICLGIESGNRRVRKDVQKDFNPDLVLDSVQAAKDAGIHVIGNYLFGLPEEDYESMGETLALAKELNCEFANFYCAMAYPGSALYERCVLEKLPLPGSWTGYSQHAYDTLPLPTKHLTGPEVLRFRDDAFHDYFTDLRYLGMIKETFGEAVAAHVREMTENRLKRKWLE